ncbi:NAD-dependent epimerase/dehydratase family protein [Rhodococcus hoagii]|jgi:nucleoside-diphosphate-sugar epimerase|uniref:NAD-dependent epimerase/dehydratase family protein n=2 Tax=Rhodococcus hoagii TaxID=43767 RepID=A0AAE2W965_RHOHA|nr:NAD(P)-dependent oxidoreductase [Prescottella equi]MBU4614236.1 NAD(P)-dependent oxidoreductase [Rhodococcus sp. GG48]MCD7051099.1 NAD(P)-dependent oxidoreductase [Rhodococcus sp. BH2-1]GBF12879.1 NAD dependent epimerase/dehydratase family protein [Rhodococcus sp. Br-6]MBM4475337.1 NAD-dependent epimerase/dehydratase family protein [Prescottella equi]MBM4485671.1 NAD-dependent epimerase/dehydratase family protein [Prescottella equi]
MKILIVGGTGMIGAHTALHLRDQGNDVTVAARNPLADDSPVRDFPVLLGDYTEQTFTVDDLAPFEAVVFAAGQDIRHMGRDVDEAEFWEKTQTGGVPRFAALAKEAGVSRFVQVGSYYHHLRPEYAETMPYVAARKAADEGARALADENFNVSTLNPPSILGAISGVSAKRYRKLFSWAAGNEPQIPDFAPAGGTNYMSAQSLAEAIWGALQNAESGRAYLIGDQNLTFAEYFQLLVDAAGGDRSIEERNEEHPLLPDSFIVQGRGNVIAYDTDPAETALLGYTQGDCARAIAEMYEIVKAATAR